MSLEKPKKKFRGRSPRAPARAYAPRTLRSRVPKNDLPASSFLLYTLPRKCTLLALFVKSLICIHINTHFGMFLHNVTCMLVVLFFWIRCVRKHECKVQGPDKYSHKNGEVNAMFEMKNVAFWVKLPWSSFLKLWQCGVFSVTKVCVFFTNGVYRKLFTTFSS